MNELVDAYTVKEVAMRLQISEAMVQRMVARKEIPHMRFGKAIRIPVESYNAWLKEQAGRAFDDHDAGVLSLAPRLMMPPR